jgi:hypothetical protein
MDESPITPIPAPDESEREALGQFYEEMGLALRAAAEAEPGDTVAAAEAEHGDTVAAIEVEPGDLVIRVRHYSPVIVRAFLYPAEVVSGASGLGAFGLPLAIAAVPAFCTALGAWLGSRNGRKVRLKIGDIEAEAQTREDVEALLARAQEIQQQIAQRNQQPKLIP